MKNGVRLIQSSRIYSGSINLSKDKFSLNGKIIEKELVGHQNSVGIVAIRDDSVILITQYRRAANKVLLEIPAGKIENDETPREAAVREMAEHRPDLRWVLIAAEPVIDVDTTAADMLEELDEWLNARGVSLVFAEMKDPVREKIERYELTRTIDPGHFFPTLDEAIERYVADTGATWHPPERSLPEGRAPEGSAAEGGSLPKGGMT